MHFVSCRTSHFYESCIFCIFGRKPNPDTWAKFRSAFQPCFHRVQSTTGLNAAANELLSKQLQNCAPVDTIEDVEVMLFVFCCHSQINTDTCLLVSLNILQHQNCLIPWYWPVKSSETSTGETEVGKFEGLDREAKTYFVFWCLKLIILCFSYQWTKPES